MLGHDGVQFGDNVVVILGTIICQVGITSGSSRDVGVQFGVNLFGITVGVAVWLNIPINIHINININIKNDP